MINSPSLHSIFSVLPSHAYTVSYRYSGKRGENTTLISQKFQINNALNHSLSMSSCQEKKIYIYMCIMLWLFPWWAFYLHFLNQDGKKCFPLLLSAELIHYPIYSTEKKHFTFYNTLIFESFSKFRSQHETKDWSPRLFLLTVRSKLMASTPIN